MEKTNMTGFNSKQRMAADKLQEPVAWMWKDVRGKDIVSLFEPRLNSVPLYTAQPQPARERNFCERCGKRTADLTAIHTCTPPQGNA
jgi:hypothetical protein